MNPSIRIDLGLVARDLDLPAPSVERTMALLDEGNTVPFITRYRKDQTGGLDEEQIRGIQFVTTKLRQLAERKQTILKTIESQGKLTPELAEQIQHATTPKRLEDLYLPYKPKKTTLATTAREQGLEPLALEILDANPAANDLEARLNELISAEKSLPTSTEVLQGVGYLIAERYGDSAELRGRLRRIFHRSGKLICTKVEAPVVPEAEPSNVAEGNEGNEPQVQPTDAVAAPDSAPAEVQADLAPVNVPESAPPVTNEDVTSVQAPAAEATNAAVEPESAPAVAVATEALVAEPEATPTPQSPEAEAAPTEATPASPAHERLFDQPAKSPGIPNVAQALKRAKKKKKKKVIGEHAFKDYYNFQEALHRVPPHRVLAINRGERARAIRVKIEADLDAMQREAEHLLVRSDHPHAEFLKQCVRDTLSRLLVPSLERETRREQTERAEEHAVEVFIRNLRKLLLQQPVRGRRVLAIDPGFKSGCKMVALDEFGNVKAHGVVYVIGKDDRRAKARERLATFARQHKAQIVAIGNGTGCREAEQLVADVLLEELKDSDVAYVVVNEAGASIYSTSPLGREELPQYDALQRGAISIGRRLLDPLSEMVKINPANLGVGLYQHDVKAKHLQESLDGVVESCVNFVGVDVNSASPALLRYVSGMNALTARRVYEYRREHGPFKNREELKKVTGFGDQTFVQSAGFLKIIGGENPLDATWIHPESYDIARRVLDKLGCELAELAKSVPLPPKPPEKPAFAAELGEEARPAIAESTQPAAESPPPAGEATDGTAASSVSAEPATETASTESAAPPTAVPQAETQTSDAAASVPAGVEAVASPPESLPAAEPVKNVIAERAATVDVHKLAEELAIGTHLLQDILASLTRPGIDPRDNLPSPLFRRGIMKLEDLQNGMELAGTVLNVVDFGVFVDIGLSDSGLVHISRLADRYIKDPHEVVGVGDVLKVWVVDVDKTRRRVSLTAIQPGTQRPQQREERPQRPPRPPRQQQPQNQGAPPAHGSSGPQAGQGQGAPPRGGGRPAYGGQQQGQRPPRPQGSGGGGGGGGGRRDQRGGRPQQPAQPKVIERPPTKPKVVKPITKAMEEGKAPMRSFSDLLQLMDKKKDKDKKPKEEDSSGSDATT